MTSASIDCNIKCLSEECPYAKQCMRRKGIDYDDIDQSYASLSTYCNEHTGYVDYIPS